MYPFLRALSDEQGGREHAPDFLQCPDCRELAALLVELIGMDEMLAGKTFQSDQMDIGGRFAWVKEISQAQPTQAEEVTIYSAGGVLQRFAQDFLESSVA